MYPFDNIKKEFQLAKIIKHNNKTLEQIFQEAAARQGFEPALLYAIASRESHMGQLLDSRGLGDKGNGYGIMQIDKRAHPKVINISPFDHSWIVDYGSRVLKDALKAVNSRNIKDALAAYNAGAGAVNRALLNKQPADSVTTGRDYSKDVWERFILFQKLFDQEKELETEIEKKKK